jgi:mono/diheme cytochrome c family protein
MKAIICLATLLINAGLLTAFAEVDFVKQIKPIFEKSCIECHGPEKQKGKLRLDSPEAALKGGQDGPVIVPKDAAGSDLYRRITLPKEADDVMPNKGDLLTKQQTDLIRDWINQGAAWSESSAAKQTVAPAAASVQRESPTVSAPELPKDFKPTAEEEKAIAKLAEGGLTVRPIALSVPWREADFGLQGTNVTDAAIAPLRNITSLVEVNLARTKVTDAGLESIGSLPHLQRLHLELTAVTDAGLAKLTGLSNLVYLNLYGTAVTDAGLEHLKGMKYLRKLYLFESKVTAAGVADLKKALPGLDIST